MTGALARAYGRALRSQFTPRMLLLSLLPLLLSVLLWGGLMWLWLQNVLDWLEATFAAVGGFRISSSVLGMLGLGMFKAMAVPLVAMLLLVPLTIASSLLFIGVAAMPAIARHVGRRGFAALEQRHGGSLFGSIGVSLGALAGFALAWLLTLPLLVVPPLALLAQALLWGWLSARVMGYDALAAYASADERRQLLRRHRWPLLAIGTVSGLAGALPGLAWIGGALISFVLFPFLALLSVWLYLLIFIFTGLWFQYYCLQALAEQRADAATQHG